MSYSKPNEDEWVQPVRKGYKMACCDCGLVHEMDFRIHKGRVQFRARRHARATGGKRAAMWRAYKPGLPPRPDASKRTIIKEGRNRASAPSQPEQK